MTGKSEKQNLNDNYKIMIVGGGPAGISTWLHLHKYNPEIAAKTILIEKEKYPRDKLCGGALGGWGQEILKKLEIDLDISSVSIDNTEYRLGKEKFSYKKKNFLRIFRRIEFDYALAKTTQKRGLFIKEGESFQDFSYKKDDIIVNTNKGKYQVKILIGADGALSKVRKKMNLSLKPHFAPAMEIFAPVNPLYDPEFESNTAVLDFTPIKEGLQGYVWHFPCIIDGKPSMNHGICNAYINTTKPRANLKKIFSRELDTRKINCKPSSWSGYPVPWFSEITQLSRPNIFLVGDAAGIEPLLGGGIHLALSYGEAASMTALDAISNNNYTFADYKEKLQNHITGKYIRKLTYLANEVYYDRINILDAIKKVVQG